MFFRKLRVINPASLIGMSCVRVTTPNTPFKLWLGWPIAPSWHGVPSCWPWASTRNIWAPRTLGGECSGCVLPLVRILLESSILLSHMLLMLQWSLVLGCRHRWSLLGHCCDHYLLHLRVTQHWGLVLGGECPGW